MRQKEEKEKMIVSSGKMTTVFISNFIAWRIVIGLISSFLYQLAIVDSDEYSIAAIAIYNCISVAITIFLSGYFATKRVFKKHTIYKIDVQSMMISIIVFFIIIFIIGSLYTYKSSHDQYNELINSNSEIAVADSYIDIYGTEEEKQEYYEQKEQIIAEFRQDLNTILIFSILTSLVVYGLMIPYEKRMILKYCIEDDFNSSILTDETETNDTDGPIL